MGWGVSIWDWELVYRMWYLYTGWCGSIRMGCWYTGWDVSKRDGVLVYGIGC